MSESQQSTIDILNYLFHLTSPRYVEGFKDFYHDLFQNQRVLSAIRGDISKFLLSMENYVYKSQIKEVGQAIKISLNTQSLFDELKKLHDYTDNPTGYLKSVRVYGALKKGQIKIRKLKIQLSKLHLIVGIIIEKYPNSYGNKIKILLGKYKFIRVSSFQDYQNLLWFEKEQVFISKNFRLLERYVFIYFNDNSIDISELYQLMYRLKTGDFNIYFLNVRKFQKIFPDYKKEHYPLTDINIFSRTGDFTLLQLFLSALRLDSCSRKNFNNETRFLEYEVFLLTLNENLRKNINIGKFNFSNYYINLSKLANSNIQIEPTYLMVFHMTILLEINSIDLMILFGIKGLYGYDDINALEYIIKFVNGHSNFNQERIAIRNLWMRAVDNSLRDANHLYLFLQLYYLLGREFFHTIISRKHKLSSSNMHDLYFQSSSEHADSVRSITQNILTKVNVDSQNRRVVLVVAPKYDHNMAISNSYHQFRRISTEAFETHFMRIGSANQLGFVIKSMGKLIDILIIDAHSNSNLIAFSHSKGNDLDKKALNSKAFNNTNKCFSKGAICYLSGCSTAKGSEPIADALSAKLGIQVIGAKKDTSSQITLGKSGEPRVYSTSRQKKFVPN